MRDHARTSEGFSPNKMGKWNPLWGPVLVVVFGERFPERWFFEQVDLSSASSDDPRQFRNPRNFLRSFEIWVAPHVRFNDFNHFVNKRNFSPKEPKPTRTVQRRSLGENRHQWKNWKPQYTDKPSYSSDQNIRLAWKINTTLQTHACLEYLPTTLY